MSEGFTIEESARRLGHLRWWSLQLFERLGRWAADVDEVEPKLFVAAAARHHAWHADLLGERLPTSSSAARALSPDAQTVPPDGATPFLAALDGLEGPGTTLEKLVVAERVVVPRLVAAQTAHLDACSPVADGPTMRSLRIVLSDELDDWRVAQGLLVDLTRDAAAVKIATDCQARL